MKTIKEAAREISEKVLAGTPHEGDEALMAEHLGMFAAGVAYAQQWISIEDELPGKGTSFVAKGMYSMPMQTYMRDGSLQPTFGEHKLYIRLSDRDEECYRYLKADLITHWRPVDMPL
ncbi:MAG: DUF551 domain-containing protein [Mediterranea sp.]|jgi:hypothetical protein|nr:DUF551 domain-containing protein [Mediterranea sp.]